MKFKLLLFSVLFSVLGWGQGNENFENIPTASSTSYLARTWTGTDGVTWNATSARTDQTLTAKAICTNGSGTVTSPTYSGGMGVLTFDYVRGFTGTSPRSLTVWVNGVQIGGTTTVNATSSTVQNYSATINVAGNVSLEIRTAGAQIVIDNISWTPYASCATPNPTGTITATQNCGNTSLTYSAPSATLYWQTSATGTDFTYPTTAAYTATTNGTYYVRAHNGTCWSAGTVSLAVTVVNPVVISGQPSTTAQNLCQSAAATGLSVTASGSGLTYQWYSNTANAAVGGTLIGGATSATYTPSTAVAGTLYYYCIVTGTCSAATSNVSGAVNVTALPANPSGSITATQNCGSTQLNYSAPSASLYWQTSATGTSTANATTAPYNVTSNGTYYVRAFNGTCWSTGTVSQAVTVVNAVAISVQPANQSTTVGNTATFNVTAVNAASYQWQVSTDGGATWTNVGGNSNSYTTPATTLAMSGSQYQVIVTGNAPCGNVTSSAAMLSVTTGPCLSENFEATPSGWVMNSITYGGQNCEGSAGMVFNAAGDAAVTPAIANPQSLTFLKKRSSNTTAWALTVQVGLAATGPWTDVTTITAIGTNCDLETVDLSAYSSGTYYIRLLDTRAAGLHERTIDDLKVFCGTPIAGPEIDVTGNSITIADGDTTPMIADGTNFGVTALNVGVSKTYVIQNLGTTDLVLTGPVTLSDVSAPQEFTVVQPSVTTLAPGDSTSFTVAFNSAVAGTFTNTVNIPSNDTDEATYNFDIIAIATDPATVTGTVYNPGELIFVGYDGQVLGSFAHDEYLIATLVDMVPGTNFTIVNSRYEAGAAANVRTNKWGGGGDNASEAPYEARIVYNGTTVIPAGSVLRFQTDDSADWFGRVDVTVGTTTTNRTADFSGTPLPTVINNPNISLSGSDQLYLIQGDFVFDGTVTAGQANYYLNGTLLHGLTNRAAWVPLSSACNGGSTGGNSRESRLPAELLCFNVENVNGSAISAFYENDKEHGLATIRQIVLSVSDVANNWTLGTGRYTIDPVSNLTTRAGKTFSIGASNPPGSWAGTVDNNWFNCANWEGLAVPKVNTNVFVNATAVNPAVVDYTATYSNDYNDIAVCNDLTINGQSVVVEGNLNNKLEVHGNLMINGSGALDMDDSNAATADGQLYLTGNWSNTIGNTAFEEGNGTVHFNGTTPQIINNVTPIGTEVFYNVVLNNNFDTATSNDLIASGDLTVATAKTLNIDATGFAQVNKKLTHNGTITVQNDGQFIQIDETDANAGTYTGTRFQVKRNADNIRSLDYVYWSAPVENTNVASINGTLRYYWNTTAANPNGTQGYWLAASGMMNKGQGYIVRGPSSFATPQTLSVDFNGKPFNGQFNYPITRGTNPTSNDDNLILVGNPYASAIDADAFLAANPNIEGAVRIWTHGTLPSSAITSPFYENFVANYTANDYIVYNGTATTVPGAFDGKIASGQGFFITMLEAGAAAQNITFRNAMRGNAITGGTLDNTQFFRNTAANVQHGNIEKNRIWLDLISTNGQISKTVVGYVTGATMEKDNRYDAYAKLNYGMTFYSLVGEEAIHIQGRALPFEDKDFVPMGMQLLTPGSYTIAIAHLDGLFAGNQNIYLEDRLLNIVHNLKDSPYSFTADAAGFVNNRFVLRYKNASLSNDDFETPANTVTAYGNGGVVVKSTTAAIKEVVVYDVLGRTIAQKKNVASNEVVLPSVRQTQSALIVKITLENGQVIDKKILY